MSFLLSFLLLAQPPAPKLPPPNGTPSVTKHPKVIGWPEGKTPTAPPGFKVTLYADKFDNPRWLYVLPNGDVLVAESRTLPTHVSLKSQSVRVSEIGTENAPSPPPQPSVRRNFASRSAVGSAFTTCGNEPAAGGGTPAARKIASSA